MRSQPPFNHHRGQSDSNDYQRPTQGRSQPKPHPRSRPNLTRPEVYRQEQITQSTLHPQAHRRPRPPIESDSHLDAAPRAHGTPPGGKTVTRRRWWPVLVPLALLVVVVSLVTPAGRHQWALSIFRQPTKYTELSFNNAAALPKTAAANKPIDISFNIGNNEGEAVKYRYVVSESPSGKSKTLYSAEKNISPGAAQTIQVTVRPTCTSSPCEIVVSLPGHPETIDFLVNLTS